MKKAHLANAAQLLELMIQCLLRMTAPQALEQWPETNLSKVQFLAPSGQLTALNTGKAFGLFVPQHITCQARIGQHFP